MMRNSGLQATRGQGVATLMTMDRPLARLRQGALIVLGAVLLAGCQDDTMLPTTPVIAPAVTPAANVHAQESGAIVAWNLVARNLVKKYLVGAAPAIRAYALLSAAQFQAVVTAEETGRAPVRASESAAAAAASVEVLTYLFPNESAYLEGVLDQQEQSPFPGSQGKSFSAGEQIGRAAAATIVAHARTDRFFDPFTGTVPSCAGCWLPVPTPPAFATLGNARTFFLTQGNQFRPAPPPVFGSAAFLKDLAEVRAISDARTPTQDSIAKFWSLQGGTVTPLGYWNEEAERLVAKYNLNDRKASRVYATMNMAGYDAIVASHEAKYHYWLIRPSQADNQITLPIALPSFPAYPSNHAAISMAAALVLANHFPAERGQLIAKAEQAAVSRIYGGIHYRFDATAGLALGRQVAQLALSIGPRAALVLGQL